MTPHDDRQLGMGRAITRRDFLNGVSIAVSGSLFSTPLVQALAAQEVSAGDLPAQMLPGYYPPERDGLRGSHPGSFEVAHSRAWAKKSVWGPTTELAEEYDLLIQYVRRGCIYPITCQLSSLPYLFINTRSYKIYHLTTIMIKRYNTIQLIT